MRRDPAAIALALAALVGWAALIAAPLAGLYLLPEGISTTAGPPPAVGAGVVLRTFALAAALAAGSVLLGYLPGRLLGTARRGRGALFLLMLAPLMLPRYLLWYAWDLLRSPTTTLGDYISARPELARAAGAVTGSMVLVLWYWPLAALLIAQGWRSMDRDLQQSATLDASGPRRLVSITLPLLAPALLLAFGVCFVLVSGEFAAFHLSRIDTLGTALSDLYSETLSATAVARSAWPAAIPAVIVAVALWRRSADWATEPALAPPDPPRHALRHWAFLAALMGVGTVLPLVLLAAALRDARPFADFWQLHQDELATSLLVAGVGAAAALLIAAGALTLEHLGRAGRIAAWLVHPTILLAALLPGSLLGASLVKVQAALRESVGFRDGWYSVSAGLAARLAGIALIVLRLGLSVRSRHLAEMAAVDRASWARTWWHVHLPLLWALPVGAFALVTMLGVTELSASTVLLPAGVPSFAQGLLNQMHYARNQQVIASCLILVGAYAAVGAAALGAGWLLRRAARRGAAGLLLAACLAATAAGCSDAGRSGQPKVVGSFGRTGRGNGEFLYPRAIDIAPDQTLWVVDKTARLQHLDRQGRWLGGFAMPLSEAGMPTGLSVGPDGNLYVADTHYNRVMVFSPDGRALWHFGSYGHEAGQFIYPTDVAFAPDGRIFVSEYGGHDRVSIFDARGKFLASFGTFGDGPGQLSRPSALQVDAARGRLYVADACNHRIAVYDLTGRLQRYIGSVGRGPGELRYPYDLALTAAGRLIVCEYGNNRVQVFDAEGRTQAVLGGPGRQLGQLAFPWAVCVDTAARAYVVDAGNNRIQVWRLP